MRTAIGICVLLTGMSAVPAFARGTPPVRVYVWTARPEIVGLDQKDREDSVADIKNAMTKGLESVGEHGFPEIAIEVVRRDLVPTGAMEPNPFHAFGRVTVDPVVQKTLFVTLRFRDYHLDLACSAGAENAMWRRTAENCVSQIRKFAVANLGR